MNISIELLECFFGHRPWS